MYPFPGNVSLLVGITASDNRDLQESGLKKL